MTLGERRGESIQSTKARVSTLDSHFVETTEALTLLFHCQHHYWTPVSLLMRSWCWSSTIMMWRADSVFLWWQPFVSRLVLHGICNGQYNASSAKGSEGPCTTHQFHWPGDGVSVPLLANLKLQGLRKGKQGWAHCCQLLESVFWNGCGRPSNILHRAHLGNNRYIID